MFGRRHFFTTRVVFLTEGRNAFKKAEDIVKRAFNESFFRNNWAGAATTIRKNGTMMVEVYLHNPMYDDEISALQKDVLRIQDEMGLTL